MVSAALGSEGDGCRNNHRFCAHLLTSEINCAQIIHWVINRALSKGTAHQLSLSCRECWPIKMKSKRVNG